MADTLRAHISLNIAISKVKDLDIKDVRDDFTDVWELKLASGTGDGNCDLYFRDTRTLTTGADESLDLAGSLTDPFGSTITFAKIKFLAVKNNSTTQTISVGGAAANQFAGMFGDTTDILDILPNTADEDGGWAVIICDPAGVAVTGGTGDLLKIANSAGATATYDIIIVGASA